MKAKKEGKLNTKKAKLILNTDSNDEAQSISNTYNNMNKEEEQVINSVMNLKTEKLSEILNGEEDDDDSLNTNS